MHLQLLVLLLGTRNCSVVSDIEEPSQLSHGPCPYACSLKISRSREVEEGTGGPRWVPGHAAGWLSGLVVD